eukprot:179670-Hanusia_phi.AAC.1
MDLNDAELVEVSAQMKGGGREDVKPGEAGVSTASSRRPADGRTRRGGGSAGMYDLEPLVVGA